MSELTDAEAAFIRARDTYEASQPTYRAALADYKAASDAQRAARAAYIAADHVLNIARFNAKKGDR